MERRLFIVRHGKSSWDHEDLDDVNRPLAERGKRNAWEMSGRMLDDNMVPQLLLSSPASRALNTALIMMKRWELGPGHLQIHDPLYMARPSDVEEVVSSVDPGITDLAIFGHNPTFTQYANQFLEMSLENLPTAGVVMVVLDSENWDGLGRKNVKETYVDYPKRK